MKQCTKCGESKPLADFYEAAGMRDGHRNDCIPCNKGVQRTRYKADPATAIAKVKFKERIAERVAELMRMRDNRLFA
ncbi:MAG TPA: hypothetical protein VM121_11265 [Acidimicrobiales bacterium]|nr:hypothetical protein [Acidimicrobiales bacterium]